jgi:2-oxo-3-hexenedioate decarboxylase
MSASSVDAQTDVQAVAAEAFATLANGRQIASFSARHPAFDLDEAYRATAAVRQMRESRGERPVGRKIGFTNRAMWIEHGVRAPIWGYVYDTTVRGIAEIDETFSLAGLAEPRIEPEIVFGLAAAPAPGMDERALLACVDWVAHGFEIVHSIFPGWTFSAPDTVAAFGLHGALLVGARHSVAARPAHWSERLSTFAIELKRDGMVIERGRGSNVLGGPLSALRHLVDLLANDPVNPPLAAGEIVTTGTLTLAQPAAPGETWTTRLTGIALGPLRVRFAEPTMAGDPGPRPD